MDDAVRISAETFRSIYEIGFKTWTQLDANIEEKSMLPQPSQVTQEICHQHPVLTRHLNLKIDQMGAFATGGCIWSSHRTKCAHAMPPFRQPVRIKVAAKKPVSLSMSEPTEDRNTVFPCFIRDQDYISVLMLAWAYILSSRWTEIMPGTCSLAYTDSQAIPQQNATLSQGNKNFISVQLGHVSPEEARWWAAILAPGQGWQANLEYEQQTFLAPWSIDVQKDFEFLLLHSTDPATNRHSVATFSDAIHYLNRFCARHVVSDQSHAALAAVLLLPSMGTLNSLRLPTPSSKMGVPHSALGSVCEGLQDDWIHRSCYIDKLLTLSCNTRGIRPLLLSIFYEPNIECNAVTPWLQGTLAAIKHVASDNSYLVGRLCMERSPRVAFLWLGCIILNIQNELLREVYFGQIPIDLPSASWSRTIQSFIQQRVSDPLATDGLILRADECRLLFLSQSERHTRLPLCQWTPFGKTTVSDVDLEVRLHQQCQDHWLQYEGIEWESNHLYNHSHRDLLQISYEGLDRDREAISENATRNIFGCLRVDGYGQGEQDIWKYEWFDMSDSDDNDVDEEDTTSDASAQLSPRVESWVFDVSH
ncbi:unnamed protein product [Fusarium graminearum]|nr:hypothetical protein HG531_004871 [Fusarium graminearum]VTO85660.1 unnamed protein product [Fusarium graminearum]